MARSSGPRPLVVLSVGVGGVLVVPAWFAWLGVVLRREVGQ